MTTHVDLLVVGLTVAGESAAVDAARRGRRVLVVDRSTSRARRRRLRRALADAGLGLHSRVSVTLGVEVVCVAGVGSIEAVLLRRIRTGRLLAINTSNLLDTKSRPGSLPAGSTDSSDGRATSGSAPCPCRPG